MEVSSRGLSRTTTDLQVSRRWKGRDQQTSPERTKVWTEPNKNKPTGNSSERKVPVVYYLSRNGQLEHPHFMDVPLSSPEGLYLRGTSLPFLTSFLCLVGEKVEENAEKNEILIFVIFIYF